jgi:hypothetical protein
LICQSPYIRHLSFKEISRVSSKVGTREISSSATYNLIWENF